MSNSPSQARTTPNGMFRLLVPAADPTPPGFHTIELQGGQWMLSELARKPDAADIPEYTSVSYAWGRGRTVNPFDKRLSMSDRTIPVLEATIRARQPKAIWIDGLCVPPEEPARTTCLLSMGAIYSKATEVVAVLSKSCSDLLEQINRTGRVDTATLGALEADIWVTRAWTYQEVVNSKSIYFIVEERSDVSIGGEQFLNSVGQAIDEYKKAHGYDSFNLRSLYPRLDSLENLILDWRIAEYLERSAYQVMSAMVLRGSERPRDRSYAMVGAITTTPVDAQDAPSVPPAEYFMRVCEAKGDYSFIYSIEPRSEIPGKCWRPVADPIYPIHPILPWPSDGKGQSGHVYPTHLQLNNMCCMTPGSVGPAARQFAEKLLQDDNAIYSSGNIPALILQRLRDAGFSGCGEHMELESGYFFPQTPVAHMDEVFVAVATGVQWVFGAPGLLVRGNSTGIHHYCGVGVFVGPIPQVGHSINIGLVCSITTAYMLTTNCNSYLSKMVEQNLVRGSNPATIARLLAHAELAAHHR